MTFHFHALEKEVATHSSVLAWRIPGTGEPGWAALSGVAQSLGRLKRLTSSSDQYKEIEENNKIGKTRDLFKKIRDIKRIVHAKMST